MSSLMSHAELKERFHSLETITILEIRCKANSSHKKLVIVSFEILVSDREPFSQKNLLCSINYFENVL